MSEAASGLSVATIDSASAGSPRRFKASSPFCAQATSWKTPTVNLADSMSIMNAVHRRRVVINHGRVMYHEVKHDVAVIGAGPAGASGGPLPPGKGAPRLPPAPPPPPRKTSGGR